MNETNVKPALLAGFQDTLPSQMIPLQKVLDVIKKTYELFGFVPLDTPGMERLEVLTGGSDDFNKSIYMTRIVRGAEDVGKELLEENAAMRFDLTVPLARVVAAYSELPRPFKRYQIGKVWRGEKPQNNRYREFVQFDADIIGSDSILADTEIVELMYTTLKTLGLPAFTIKVNDRRILNGLGEVLGCRESCKELDRTIDKMPSIGIDGVISELMSEPESAFATKLVFNNSQAERLREFLKLRSTSSSGLLAEVEKFFASSSAEAQKGIDAMKALAQNLANIGIPESFWEIDLSVARGLDYYSGPVFETNVEGMPDLGSIFSGGRFDGLVSRFIPNSNMPGVGASIGVERLMTALGRIGKVKEEVSLTKVLVTVFDPALANNSFLVASTIRKASIPTELYLGTEKTIRAQLGYALKQGIPYVVIMGPDEVQSGRVALKNLAQKTQETLTLEEAIAKIAAALK